MANLFEKGLLDRWHEAVVRFEFACLMEPKNSERQRFSADLILERGKLGGRSYCC